LCVRKVQCVSFILSRGRRRRFLIARLLQAVTLGARLGHDFKTNNKLAKKYMVTVSLIKILITLAGLLGTFGLAILGLVTKDKSKIKRAGILFVGTWVILILITIIEFAVA
jgi:hypothetical protein